MIGFLFTVISNMKKKENRGGVREGAGRNQIEEEKQKRRNISLSDKWAGKAKLIGGDISKGIRIALENYDFSDEETNQSN